MMTTELEEMRRMIQIQRETYERNIDHLIAKLHDLKKIGSVIGELSQYDCLAAVRREFNDEIAKMLSPE